MKIRLFLSIFLFSVPVVQAQEENLLNRANFRLHQEYADQFDRFSASSNEFRLLETLNRTPLFDNLPFLKLRTGDQIVRGQVFYQPVGKGIKIKAEPRWSEPLLFLQRGGKRTKLYALEEAGKLQLVSPTEIPYFDWAPTRENADALFEFCQPKPRISLAQLANLDAELQPEFAEYLGAGLTPLLKEGANAVPGFLFETREKEALKFVYAGFGYNSEKEVFQYRFTLGAHGWREVRAPLISAPPRPRSSLAPQQAASKRDLLPRDLVLHRRQQAQNARCIRFEAIVTRVLNPQ